METPRRRYQTLDTLRGVTIVSMILYHACWDLVWIFGADWPWYRSDGAYLWQQSICWTFILLSGYCWSLGRHRLRRGLMAERWCPPSPCWPCRRIGSSSAC